MGTRRVNFDNATPGVKLFERDILRTAFTIHVPSTEDAVALNDAPFSPGDAVAVILQPGDTAHFACTDGYDTTRPWYIISETIGTNYAYVHEEWTVYEVLEYISKITGITVNAGTPLLPLFFAALVLVQTK